MNKSRRRCLFSGGAYFLSLEDFVVLIFEHGAYFRMGLFSEFYGNRAAPNKRAGGTFLLIMMDIEKQNRRFL